MPDTHPQGQNPLQPALAPAGRAEEHEHDEPLDQLSPYFREGPLEPEGAEAPPMWLWISIFGILLSGAFYLGAYIGDFSPYPWLRNPGVAVATSASSAAPVAIDGAQVFQARCAACHQANGEGVPGVFPPLAGSKLVTGEKGVLIRIVLHGIEGEIQVAGTTYNGLMPGWSMLSDEQIAAVTTHERMSWGNEAAPITAAEVAAVRDLLADRTAPWTAEELARPENQMIPASASANAEKEATPTDTTLAE